MLRVGCVNYINVFPLICAIKEKILPCPWKWVFDVPSSLNRLLEEKKIDVSLSSSTTFLKGNSTLFPPFCVGAKETSHSTNLYIKENIHSLDGILIALTSHSAATVALLKTLCAHFWHVSPRFMPLEADVPYDAFDALLLIGDEALKHETLPGFRTLDLGKEWHKATSLPFIFAVFTLNPEVALTHKSELEALEETLSASLEWGETHRDEVVALAQKQCSLPAPILNRYYDAFFYRVDEKAEHSLQTFATLLRTGHGIALPKK